MIPSFFVNDLAGLSFKRTATLSTASVHHQNVYRGFGVYRRDHYIAIGHSGAVAGYQAALYINSEKHVAVITLANSTGEEAVDTYTLALKALDPLSK